MTDELDWQDAYEHWDDPEWNEPVTIRRVTPAAYSPGMSNDPTDPLAEPVDPDAPADPDDDDPDADTV